MSDKDSHPGAGARNPAVARALLAAILMVVGTGCFLQTMAQEAGDSFEIVMRLSKEFENSGNVSALTSLAQLVPSDGYGANAAGALVLLARKVKPRQAEKVIVPALVEGLSSTNTAVRREAAIALSEYSAYVAPVMPRLIEFLKNSREADKLNADYFVIEALGRLGRVASPAIPTLLMILDWPGRESPDLGDMSPRAAAVAAIDRIGFSDPSTRLRLENALSDKNLHVRFAAASALVDNSFASVPALLTLSETVTNDITFTLEPITLQRARTAATNANPSVRDAARTLLRKTQKQSAAGN